MAVELGAVPLNDRAVRGEDYRDLGGGLATAASQKRLNLSVCGVAFLSHQALGAPHIIWPPARPRPFATLQTSA